MPNSLDKDELIKKLSEDLVKANTEIARLNKGFHESCITKQEFLQAALNKVTAENTKLKADIEKLTKNFELMCERAIIDFDDEAVGIINRSVGTKTTYGDWLKEVLDAYNKSKTH